MLKQASVDQIRRGEVTREDGYVVISMCFYPRGLKRELRDAYRSDMAPDAKLFKDWQKEARLHGHDEAFEKSDYENRFQLSEHALFYLKGLSEIARGEDVFLVCQCGVGEKCHREILLLVAEKLFGAKIARVYHEYPKVLRRFSKEKQVSP